MEPINKTFKTGQSYTLSDIFKTNHRKIVIPDLQRDYCWGGKNLLVPNFVQSLLDNQDKTLPLGLIYGYEEIEGHINLCDGQQRITTLFLLIGMLNRKVDGNPFQHNLISDFELINDDKEPYLQYSIREESLYFLSDLVCNFFLNQNIQLGEIKKQSWYFEDYENDPSIESMLKALNEIDNVLNSKENIDYNAFGEFILNNLTLMYYDMGSRAQGEETFVIINTTGEPLSPTENIKPRYVRKYANSNELWEKWEQWFWFNRNHDVNDTADSGMLEFFRWVILLEESDDSKFNALQEKLVVLGKSGNDNKFDFEDILKISPKIIDKYFDNVCKVFNDVLPNNKIWLSPKEGINAQIIWFRLLPVIAYLDNFNDVKLRYVIRVKQLFKNLAQISNISKDVKTLLCKAVSIIRKMKKEDKKDIAEIIYIDNISNQLITEEERLKFSIYLEANNREEIEDKFWHIQHKTDEKEDGKIWQGEIMPILEWSMVDGKFDYVMFNQFNKVFFDVFKDACDSNIDLARRALLTINLDNYPRKGGTNTTFGWAYNDWKYFINNNKDKFKLFFEELIGQANIEESMSEMIENYPKDNKNEWSNFIFYPEFLKYCSKKNIRRRWDGEYYLIRSVNLTKFVNVETYKFFIDCESNCENTRWKLIYMHYDQNENPHTVLECDDGAAAIGIIYNNYKQFYLELFNRSEKVEELESIALFHGLSFNEENSRYKSACMSNDEINELVCKIINDENWVEQG